MKISRLLVLTALWLGITGSAKAADLTGNWTMPTPTGLEFTTFTDDGERYYLYNEAAKMFFSSGNSWNTQASVRTFGYPFWLQYSEEADAPEGSYELWNYVNNPDRTDVTGDHNLFTDDGGSTWVDHASQGNYSWTFEIVNGCVRFQNVALIADKPEYEGTYIGFTGAFDGAKNSSVLRMLTPEAAAAAGGSIDWKAVTVDSYEAFAESEAFQAYENGVAAYFSALALKAAIEAAEPVYVDVTAAVALYNNTASAAADMDAATTALKELTEVKTKLKKAIEDAEGQGFTATENFRAVLTNTSATKAEVEKAISDLAAALAEWGKTNATWTKPVDMTGNITNPTFDNANLSGWSGDAFGRGGTVADGAEHYSKNYNTYQKITGLAPGVYSIGVKGFYRAGNYGGDAENHWLANDEASKYAKLYGQVGENYYEAPIANVMSGAQEENPGANAVTYTDPETGEDKTVYVPNTMAQGDIYFHELNQYANKVYVAVDETGELTIGVKKTQQIGGDWSLFDDFSLNFYGTGADACQGFVTEAMKNYSEYVIEDGTLYTASYLTAYQEAYSGEKIASTMDEVNAILNGISKAKANLDKNIELWKEYQKTIETARNMVIDDEYKGMQETEDLGDYLDFDVEDILEAVELTNEELEAEIAKMNDWMNTMIDNSKKEVYEGKIMTKFIKNPGFDEDKDINSGAAEGWTIDAGTGGNITRGPLGQGNKDLMESALGKMNYCFEAWHRYNWDVWQEVKDLPVGIYELQVQGYVRCEVGGYTRGDDLVAPYNSPVYLYMNNAMSQFPSVYSESPEDIGQEMVKVEDWYSETINDKPYPNSMGGAAQCFGWGMYKTTAYGLIAKQGDTFRIGVKMNGNQDWWCIWDSFKLIYHTPDNPDILKPELQKAMANIDLTKPMGKDVFEKASAVMAQAQAAIDSNDGAAMFTALNDLFDLNAAIIESVSLFDNLVKATESLQEALADAVNDDAIDKANNLISTINNGVENHTLTDAEAKELLETIDVLYTKLALPNDWPNASDNNPIEVTAAIKSASFVDADENSSSTGWNNPGNLGNDDTQKAAGAMEFWQIAFDMSQTIKGLPEGTYELTVDAWVRNGGNEENYEGWVADPTSSMALLYAVDGDSTVYTAPIKNMMAAGDAMQEATGYDGEATFTVGETTFYVPGSLVSGKGLIDWYPGTYTNKAIVKVGADEKLTIGIKKAQEKSNSWVVCDDFKLFYLGKNSSQTVSPDLTAIETVEGKAVKVEFFTLDGRKATSAHKGIMIQKVTLSNGATLIQKIRN